MEYTAKATDRDVVGFQTFSLTSESKNVNIALEFGESIINSKVQLFHTMLDDFNGLVTDQNGQCLGLVKEGQFIGANAPIY